MLVFAVILLLFIGVETISRGNDRDRKLIKSEPQYFSQRLDHFDSLNTATFKQKYYVEDKYFTDPTGPVILYISGEAPCGGIESWGVEMYAKPLNALFVTLEHRYYGDSSPFPHQNLSVNDLKYLSSRQALEDLANFRSTLHQTTKLLNTNSNNKWIIIGGSYSGALSAWSRLTYPHLYSGALSSSGVVNTIYNFYEFDEQIVSSVPPSCSSSLRNATSEIETLISSPTTRNETMNLFSASKLSNSDFLMMIADVTSIPVQYGYQSFLCNCFDSSNSLLNSLVNAFKNVFLKYHLGDVSSYDINTLLLPDNNPSRMWWFQKCSEMTYFQVAPSKDSIRSQQINLDWHKKRCQTAYGIDYSQLMSENSLWHYGSTKIFDQSSNTFFTNGSQDPWKRASVQGTGPGGGKNKKNNNVYVELTCENCGHCVDLYNCPGGCEKQTMVDQTRQLILKEMNRWLLEE